jgi:hypothetical protein
LQDLLGGERLPDIFVERVGDHALGMCDAKTLGLIAIGDGNGSKMFVCSRQLFPNGIKVLAFRE